MCMCLFTHTHTHTHSTHTHTHTHTHSTHTHTHTHTTSYIAATFLQMQKCFSSDTIEVTEGQELIVWEVVEEMQNSGSENEDESEDRPGKIRGPLITRMIK